LFNQARHLLLQSRKDWRVYGLRSKETKKTVALLIFNRRGKKMFSPLRAPFGSLEVFEMIEQKQIDTLFFRIEEDFKRLGILYCQIKNYPEAYGPLATRLLHHAALKLGFGCKEEVSSIIQVEVRPFEKKISISQRQKLKKSEKRFVHSQPRISTIKNVYDFISESRKEKNQLLSMSFRQLKKVVDRFPKDFLLFQVADEHNIAAAAIVIKVNNKILYTFYYAHDRRFNKISPTVMLISGIYRYAQEHQYEQIDLGTSMVNGGINRPLIQFKKSIGGQPSIKYIFDKTFS
jgi:hypothetical protein